MPHGRPERVAMAPAALQTAMGHRGAPEMPHTTPRAAGSHQGPQLPPLVARRKQAIRAIALFFEGGTIWAGYGMQETPKLFHCFAQMAAEAGHAMMASTLVWMDVIHFFHVPWESRSVAGTLQVPLAARGPVAGASR